MGDGRLRNRALLIRREHDDILVCDPDNPIARGYPHHMARRPSRRRERPRKRREATRARARVLQAVRELFSSGPSTAPDVGPPEELKGGLGVREPRRPLHPSLTGGVALELPPTEARDACAASSEGDSS
jgi:hypothetical protein